jgi:hypothetical protein
MMQQGVKSMIVAEIFPLHDAAGSQIFLLHFAAGSQILPLYDVVWSHRRCILQREILPLHDAVESQILPLHDTRGIKSYCHKMQRGLK